MANNFKPVDNTFFDEDGKPVPSVLLKREYDNIEQIDLNQRKIQVNKVWNAGRTIYENTDENSEDSPNGGVTITPNDIVGYQRSGAAIGTSGDRSTVGLRIIPQDLYGCVIPVPFYKTRTSNKIKISVSCRIRNAPMYMSAGYSLPVNSSIVDGPFPTPALVGPPDAVYSSAIYNNAEGEVFYNRIDPTDITGSFTDTDTEKLIAVDSSSSITRLIPFEFPVDFNLEGPGLVYILLAPTWAGTPGTALPFTVDIDADGLTEYNIIQAVGAKASLQAYEDLEDINLVTGPKLPYGVIITNDTDPTDVYYHSLIRALPEYVSAGNWDPADLSLMIYPRLSEAVVSAPTDYSLELIPCSEAIIYGINVREVYEP